MWSRGTTLLKWNVSLQRLARHITLPLEETVSFKDSMEQKADLKLKKIFTTAGVSCRPAVALTSIARVVRVWASNVE